MFEEKNILSFTKHRLNGSLTKHNKENKINNESADNTVNMIENQIDNLQ